MKEKRVLATEDLVFKKVFASPQYSHILAGFINDILGLDVTEVSLEDTYNIQSFYDEKGNADLRYTQVDVLARLRDGSLVGIEMQVYKQALYRERALLYTAQNYVGNYGKQDLMVADTAYRRADAKYSALRPVYSICIMLENEFLEDDQPIHHFILYDKENEMIYKKVNHQDLLNIVFLELKKSSSKMQGNIKEWFDYFMRGEVSEKAPNYVQEACKVASYQRLSKKEKDMIDAKEKREQDAIAREMYVWGEGRAEGKAEGKAEIISLMASKGKSHEEIAELIGLNQEEIEDLLNQRLI